MIRHPNRRPNKKSEEKEDTAELLLKLKRDMEERKQLKELNRRLEHELQLIKIRKGLT